MTKKIIIHESLANTLPFKEILTWEEFQKLCTDMLASRMGVVDARDYLKQGNKQNGIDVYATGDIGEKLTVAQCKLEKYLSPQDLKDIVSDFLSGSFATETKEFIVCTNYDLSKFRDENVIIEQRALLAQQNIKLIIWDESGLSTELRTNPQPAIISRYFGGEIAHAFYGSIYFNWIQQYVKIEKKQYSFCQDYIERTLISYDDHLQRHKDPYRFSIDKVRANTLVNLFRRKGSGHKILILSVAGYGKTIELENLASKFSVSHEHLYPIRNYLSDYQGQSISELLTLHHDKWSQIPEETLLLIFDGLDEIEPGFYSSFINHLNQFTEAKAKVNVILSSRFNFYDLNILPLRNFEIWILDAFSPTDVETYIQEKLSTLEHHFTRKLHQSKLQEYTGNPFYLTRMVRFFAQNKSTFPNNKAELLNSIIFERFDIEKHKRNLSIEKPQFLNLIQYIAIVMTSIGKSHLSNEEMMELVDDKNNLEILKQLSLINKHDNGKNTWSFEHKNLQEYLSALFLQKLSLETIKQLITYPYDQTIIQPYYLNTISFLFTIVDINSELFKEIFNWLVLCQPEILVRFERDRIPAKIRFKVFTNILNYYRERELGLYASSNFRISELAAFVEWNQELIDLLEKEILSLDTPVWLVYDCVNLMANCPKPYLHKDRFQTILKEAIKPVRNPRIVGLCIETLQELGWNNEGNFLFILAMNVNLLDFNIRRPLNEFLSKTDYQDRYYEFVLESIPIYKEGQKAVSFSHANQELANQIVSFKSDVAIKAILKFIIDNPSFLAINNHSVELHIDHVQLEAILIKAQLFYKGDREILRIVYKVYLRSNVIGLYKQWLKPFHFFFENTCGTKIIFHKFYRYNGRNRDVMEFADEECCDFLIEEYRNGKINDTNFQILRNTLSHANWQLFLYLNSKLKTEFNGIFYVTTTDFNYVKHEEEYKIKNQLMLLDKSLFINEIEEVFHVFNKESFTVDDIYPRNEAKLLPFQSSIVLKWFHDLLIRKSPRKKNEVLKLIESNNRWNKFRVDRIQDWMSDKSNNKAIDPELLAFAKLWCAKKIEELNYSDTVTQKEKGRYSFNSVIYNMNRLFCLLRPSLSDSHLLKMLESDIDAFDNEEKVSVSSIILSTVKDKTALKSCILNNLKKNLASPTLVNHFRLCNILGYTEILADLFTTITTNKYLDEWDKKKLTEYYTNLGGDIADFISYVEIPPIDEGKYFTTWNWFLIESLILDGHQLIFEILLKIINDKSYDEDTSHYSAELLLRSSRIEGLLYWANIVETQKRQPFDISKDKNYQSFGSMNCEKETHILLNALVFSYVNELNDIREMRETIERSCNFCLKTIAMKGYLQLNKVESAMQIMVQKYQSRSFAKSIAFQREKILQEFYREKVTMTDVKIAKQLVTQLMVSPSPICRTTYDL